MELDAAIEELYRVFQPYWLGPDFSGCDHCVDPKDTERLATTPLRDLGVSDLEWYGFKAMTTWGEVEHFKYFLPRLFELVAIRRGDYPFLETLFSKLEYGDWASWPDNERHAVD